MTKHTPAPWMVDSFKHHALGFPDRYKILNPKLSLVICDTPVNACNGQDKANAQLIAAAPDLLIEVKKQIDWLKHAKKEVNASTSIMMGFDQSIKYLELAVNKAEGNN